MERDTVWRYVEQQRLDLAELLGSLDAGQWRTPSSCPGWTVGDVAAHIISSPQAKLVPTVAAFVRHRGNFDRMVLAEGKRWGSAPPADVVAQYHRYAGSRRHPPGTSHLDPLLDVLVHGQDIAVPLGIPRSMPVAAAAAAADHVWARSFPFNARRRFRGVRLEATDTAWARGEGERVRGPIEVILLVLTGRMHAVDRLSGAGVGHLSR